MTLIATNKPPQTNTVTPTFIKNTAFIHWLYLRTIRLQYFEAVVKSKICTSVYCSVTEDVTLLPCSQFKYEPEELFGRKLLKFLFLV